MNAVAWNVLLAVAWMAITASFTAPNFVLGMAVGFVSLIVSQRIPGVPHYTGRALKVAALVAYTAREIVLANFRVSRDLLTAAQLRPALLDIPIRSRTDTEISLLAAFVTLTPGTTAVDISPDGQHMLVHFTNLPPGGIDEAHEAILDGWERRILEVLR